MYNQLTKSQLGDTKQLIKWTTFGIYITLNVILLVFLRYATILGNDKVISTTEVLMSELMKLFLSSLGCFIFDAKLNLDELKAIIWHVVYEDASDILKLSIPAVLYIIQNNLQYLIESNVALIVIYQLKVVTTALFYACMLSRKIYANEWLCIAAATVGVSIVELSQHDIEGHYHADIFIGIISVLVAITTSGFAGVYFEKILKSSKLSIWLLNMELSLVSFFVGLIICSSNNTEEISKMGFFYAYNWYTVVVIFLQAIVGIAVSLVVSMSDNIHKCFAASMSLVIVAFIDSLFFPDSTGITQTLLTGTMLVLMSFSVFVIHSHRQQKAAAFHQLHLSQLQGTVSNKKVTSTVDNSAQQVIKTSSPQADKRVGAYVLGTKDSVMFTKVNTQLNV